LLNCGVNQKGVGVATVNYWSGREARLLRHALRLTVRAFAEELGVSARTISKWEAAGPALTPRPELQAALDTMLRRANEDEHLRFVALGRAGIGNELEGSDLEQRTPARSVAAFPEVGPLIDAQAVLAESAARTAAFVIWWEATTAGPLGVDMLFSELRRLARDYLDGSPEPVILALRDVRDLVFGLLRRDQSPSQSRDLHLAAGYSCVLLSWLAGDLGELGAAGTHARAAALFCDTSGSAELLAWVQAVLSKTSFWVGDYEMAAERASAGLQVAPATSVRVLLAAQAADAWATLGAETPARAALTDVVVARDALTGGDILGGLLSFTPAREANYVSGVQHQLGEDVQAITTADEALSLSEGQLVRSYATEAQIRLNRVDVFVNLGDLDAADEAMRPVLRLPLDRRLNTLTQRLSRLGETLAAPRFAGSHTAATLRDEIANFAAGPQSSAI
jgi:transcriptional regulator with XRE-family HTH domain